MADEVLEAVEVELLLAIGEGFSWVGVDFDEEAICADGDCAAAEGDDEFCAAAALGWVYDDGEVAFEFSDGDGGEV